MYRDPLMPALLPLPLPEVPAVAPPLDPLVAPPLVAPPDVAPPDVAPPDVAPLPEPLADALLPEPEPIDAFVRMYWPDPLPEVALVAPAPADPLVPVAPDDP